MTAPALAHPRQDGVQRIDGAQQIDLDHPPGTIDIFQRAVGPSPVEHAGIGDEQVDGVFRIETGQKSAKRHSIPQIDQPLLRRGPDGPGIGRDRGQPDRITADQAERDARPRIQATQRRADAARRAGNDDVLEQGCS
jgi:hypothetical protein